MSGVLMPATDDATPWEVQDIHEKGLEKAQELDAGSGSGSEDAGEAKYAALTDEIKSRQQKGNESGFSYLDILDKFSGGAASAASSAAAASAGAAKKGRGLKRNASDASSASAPSFARRQATSARNKSVAGPAGASICVCLCIKNYYYNYSYDYYDMSVGHLYVSKGTLGIYWNYLLGR